MSPIIPEIPAGEKPQAGILCRFLGKARGEIVSVGGGGAVPSVAGLAFLYQKFEKMKRDCPIDLTPDDGMETKQKISRCRINES